MAVVGYPRLGYYDNVKWATITAGTSETGFPATSVGDGNLHTFWKPDGTGWQYLKFDFGGIVNCTFLAIVGHTLFSSGVTELQLKVGAADNGTTFDTTIATWDVDAETADVYKFFTFAALGKRYAIVTSNVVSTHPAIAVVFIGYVTTESMLSRPDRRFIDPGTVVEDSAGGYTRAENYADPRDGIYLTPIGRTDTALATWKTIELCHKGGLYPLCFLDLDTDAASGICTYGRISEPLAWSGIMPDANDIETRLFKQDL